MTIFALDLSRFLAFVQLCLGRGNRHLASTKLEGLSDRGLQDIGLEPHRQDFDTVKPFWMA